MEKIKIKNLGLLLGVSFSVFGITYSQASSGPKCDLTVAQSLEVVKTTVTAQGNYVKPDQESSDCLNAAQQCLDKITELSAGDVTVASHLKCGTPRRTNFAKYSGVIESTGCEVDVIQFTPISITQAVQYKCEKIANCIENAKNSDEIIKLKQVAQAI